MYFFCGCLQFSSQQSIDRTRFFESMVEEGDLLLGQNFNIGSKMFNYRDSHILLTVKQPDFHISKSAIAYSEQYIIAVDGLIYEIDGTELTGAATNIASIILKLIENGGIETLKRVNGDFVITVIKRKEQVLYLYRSPLGVRPAVYFWERGSEVIWSSSLNQLVKHPVVVPTFNYDYIIDYFTTPTRTNLKNTPYNNIFHVIPGECVKIDVSNVISEFIKKPELISLPGRDNNSILEHFRDTFFKCVESRLNNSNGEISIALSGGIDSSAIACAAQRIIEDKGKDIKLTLNHILHPGEGNELPYAQEVANKLGLELNVTLVESTGMFEDIDLNQGTLLLEPSDAIFGSLNVKRTSNEKAIINMTGMGGDQILSGNPHYILGLIQRKQYSKSFKVMREVSKEYQQNLLYVMFTTVLKPLLNKPSYGYELMFGMNYQLFTPSFMQKLKNSSFRFDVSTSLPTDTQYDVERIIWNEQWVGLDGFHVCNERHPFLDMRLIELCLSLPYNYKQTLRNNKIILKEALKDIMPPAIYHRIGKSPHYGSINETLIRSNLLEEILKKSMLIKLNVVDPTKYKELLGYFTYGSLQDPVGILRVLAIDIWLIMNSNLITGKN